MSKLFMIKHFITIVDMGSYELAAQQLQVNEHDLILSISQLEKALETNLFDYESLSLVLSDQGRIVFNELKDLDFLKL